jgi:dextranase
MRWIAVLLFLVALPASAAPTLTGPLIHAVNSDRQSYRAGEVASLTVQLQNTTGLTFTGTLTGKMYGRGVPVGSPAVAQIGPISNGGSATVTLPFPTRPGVNYQGYFVYIVAARTGAAVPTDTAAAAIDQSTDWSTYPRTCWATQTWTAFGAFTPNPPNPPPAMQLSGLNAWHCNVLLMYDQLYRHHVPYTSATTFLNADQLLQVQNRIMDYISIAHNMRIGTLGYFPMYAVDANIPSVGLNFLNDGSGVSLQWGLFTSNCSPNCTLAQMKGFPANPASTNFLGIINPRNPSWQNYWATQANLWLHEYGYDGLFIDTFGRWQVEPDFDYNGNPITFNGTNNSGWMSGFINAIQSKTHFPVTANPVDNSQELDVAKNSKVMFYWSEGYSLPTYASIVSETSNVLDLAHRAPVNIGVNWAWYLNQGRQRNSQCSTNGGQATCFLNLPGMLYFESTAFAAGAYHSWLLDDDRFDSNGYPISNQLSTTPAIIQAEYDYQTFGVAYEKLLRNNISTGAAPTPTITSGAVGGISGAPGQIFMVSKQRSGFKILHLLNFQQLSSTNSQDWNANYPAPTTTGPLGVKMYYTSGNAGALWMASPDINHGLAQQLPYTSGADSAGNYILFTVLSLKYWDMLWLEDNVPSSDYHTP